GWGRGDGLDRLARKKPAFYRLFTEFHRLLHCPQLPVGRRRRRPMERRRRRDEKHRSQRDRVPHYSRLRSRSTVWSARVEDLWIVLVGRVPETVTTQSGASYHRVPTFSLALKVRTSPE